MVVYDHSGALPPGPNFPASSLSENPLYSQKKPKALFAKTSPQMEPKSNPFSLNVTL